MNFKRRDMVKLKEDFGDNRVFFVLQIVDGIVTMTTMNNVSTLMVDEDNLVMYKKSTTDDMGMPL